MTNIKFKHLENADEMMSAFPLISQMYENIKIDIYRKNIEEMIRVNNFKMIAGYIDDEIVAISGYWILLMLYCGRYIQISNFIVDENKRGLGIGKKMMHYLENIGRSLNCQKFILDSYSENKRSHNLYFEQGFYIRGFHFMKDL